MSTLLVFVGCTGLSIGLVAALKGSLQSFHLANRSQAFAVVGAALLTFIAGAALADPVPPIGNDSAPLPPAPSPNQPARPEPDFAVTTVEPSATPSLTTSAETLNTPGPARAGATEFTIPPAPRLSAAAGPACDASYPDFCIAPRPPDLDCADIGRHNFTVLNPDPHGFDADRDGSGCDADIALAPNVATAPMPPPNPPPPPITRACNDGIDNDGDGMVDSADRGCSGSSDNSEAGGAVPPPPPPPPTPPVPPAPPTGSGCHPSYPGVCIPPAPPDLDCPQVQYTDFSVVGSDPHGFDADNDGIGCET